MILPELPALDAALRLGAATLAGAALGLNREMHGQSAGLRTHALVALGTGLITLVGVAASTGDGDFDSASLSRVIQGITAGIGFLGGGAILKGGREQVRGLTTAATLWVACGVGIACGAGLWHTTLIAVSLTTLVLVVGRRIDRLVHRWFPSGTEDEKEPARGANRDPT